MGGHWRAWSHVECDEAAKIFSEKRPLFSREITIRIIGLEIGRTYWSVSSRLIDYGETFRGPRRPPSGKTKNKIANIVLDERILIPDEVLAERDRRLALEHTSVGAFLCGDPLPGYSALDRVRG